MQNIQIKYALVWAIFVLLGFAANLPTEAWAGIANTLGDIEVVAPPASVQRQAYESSSEIRVFLESEQTVDSIPVNAVLPGTYHAYSDFVDQTLIPNGPIDSYFIHYDVEGQTLAQASGSITFDTGGCTVVEPGRWFIYGYLWLSLPVTYAKICVCRHCQA